VLALAALALDLTSR